MKRIGIAAAILWMLASIIAGCLPTYLIHAFVVQPIPSPTKKRGINPPNHAILHAKRKKPNSNLRPNINNDNDDNDDNDNDSIEDGEVGTGPNWIERSFPVDLGGGDSDAAKSSSSELKKVEDYNLGISGVSFQTGGLSKRMFDAIMSKSQFAANPNEEIRRAFTLCAMDFTAKEATKAALKTNGLDIALQEEEEDEGMWGDIDGIRLLDDKDVPYGEIYDSTEDAIERGGWQPGQGFDFVVRQVPAKIRELSLDELLQALDPDGALREEAKENNMTLPDEEIQSLEDLANDGVRRTEQSPHGATTEEEAFAGFPEKRGYKPIAISDLLGSTLEDGKENHGTLMHVMNAMVAHGALVVDVTDGGKTFDKAHQLARMWKGIEHFYDQIDSNSSLELPPMTTVMETGSQSAKVGYASADNNSLQFLETRRDRTTGALLPEKVSAILGESTVKALGDAFSMVTEAGKAAVRIAVAASSVEAGSFEGDDKVAASKAAALMAEELLDDGSPDSNSIGSTNFPICMSPHRLCRYSNNVEKTAGGETGADSSREVFGAHLDSTWVTIVPVAAVSGLEVFDETEESWYRPELAARKHWQNQQIQRGEDPDALVETLSSAPASLPWYSRYVVLMPGELLQLASRNEIPAAVHRVVATQDCPSRLSAPILLRCRPGVKMDVSRYLGGTGGNPLLEQCDGMTIEQIHDALQPTSFQ